MTHTYPLAYLITFCCYGTRLHGAEGSVTRYLNEPGTPTLPANPELLDDTRARMKREAYRMDARRRQMVLQALIELSSVMDWALLAAHVRTNHVHAVVQAQARPERVMTALKARSSRRLNASRLDLPGRRRWERHGSTQYLWSPADVRNAVAYVLEEQGKVLEVFRGSLNAR